MLSSFREDCSRYTGRRQRLSIMQTLLLMTRYEGLPALFAYRLGRGLQACRGQRRYLPLLPLGWAVYWLISRYARLVYDIRLELSADIAPGLYIGHFGNILVKNCRLGRYCSVHQSTHIEPDSSGIGPTLADQVWVGAHAQIAGPYEVGFGSTIGAGANLQRNVPERTLCMGNPARVAMRDYDNSAILTLPQ